MFRKQVRKRLTKFKLRIYFISTFSSYLNKCNCKVKTKCKCVHSNFLNIILISNQNNILEVKE